MKYMKVLSLFMISIFILTSCSKGNSKADVKALNLTADRYLILEDYHEKTAKNGLLDIHSGDLDLEAVPGHVYEFVLDDKMMMSYPGQINAKEATEVDKPKHIVIDLDTAENIFTLQTQNAYLIDVRSAEEFAEGHVTGAINIPVDQISSVTDEIDDKDAVIMVYCRSGNRSQQAYNSLTDLGYHVVLDAGGVNSYTGELEKGQ